MVTAKRKASGQKSKLGNGKRFAMVATSAAQFGARDPKAVAAVAGRRKYGKADMAKMAAAGRRRAGRKGR